MRMLCRDMDGGNHIQIITLFITTNIYEPLEVVVKYPIMYALKALHTLCLLCHSHSSTFPSAIASIFLIFLLPVRIAAFMNDAYTKQITGLQKNIEDQKETEGEKLSKQTTA